MAIPSNLEYGQGRYPRFRCMFAWGGDLFLVGGLNGSLQTTEAVAQQVGDPLYLNNDTHFGTSTLINGDRTALLADLRVNGSNNGRGKFCSGAAIQTPGGPVLPYRIFLHFNENVTINQLRFYFNPDIYKPIFDLSTAFSGFPGNFVVKTGNTDGNNAALYTNTVSTVTGNTNPFVVMRFSDTVCRSVMLEVSASYPLNRRIRILAIEAYRFVDESLNVKEDNWTITYKRDPLVNKFQPVEWSIEFTNPNYGAALGGRFTPKNTGSPIFGKVQADGKGWIRAGAPVEFFGGFIDGSGTLFETQILSGTVGYDADQAASNGIQMDTTEETVLISGQDRTGKLTKLFPAEGVFPGKVMDDMISRLLQYGNVSPAEMSIDPLLISIPFFVTEPRSLWDQVQEIAIAFGGIAFFDNSGIFRLKVGTTVRKVTDETLAEFTRQGSSFSNIQATPNDGFLTIGTHNFFSDPTINPLPLVQGYEITTFNNNGVPSILVMNDTNTDADKVRRATIDLSTGALGAWGDEPNIRNRNHDTTFGFRLIVRNNKLAMLSQSRIQRWAFNGGNAILEDDNNVAPGVIASVVGGAPTAVNTDVGNGDTVYHLNWNTLELYRSTFDDLLTWDSMGQIPDGGSSGWFNGRAVVVRNVLYVFGRGGVGQQARGAAVFLDSAGRTITNIVELDMSPLNFGGFAGPSDRFSVYYDGTVLVAVCEQIGIGGQKIFFSQILSSGLITPWKAQTSQAYGFTSTRMTGYPISSRYTYFMVDTSGTVRYGVSFNGVLGFWTLGESGTYTSRTFDAVRSGVVNNWIIRFTAPPVTASTIPGTITITLQDSPDGVIFTNVTGSTAVLTANTTAEGIITILPGTLQRFFRWVITLTAGGSVNTYTTNVGFVDLIGVQVTVTSTPDPTPVNFGSSINLTNFVPQDGNPRTNSVRVLLDNYVQTLTRSTLNGVPQGESLWKIEGLNTMIYSGQTVTLNIFLSDFSLPRYDELGRDISNGFLRYLNLTTSLGTFVATNETIDSAGPAQNFGIIGVIFGGGAKQLQISISATGGSFRLDGLELTGQKIVPASSAAGTFARVNSLVEDSTSIKLYNGKVPYELSTRYLDSDYLAQNLATLLLAKGKDSRYYATGVRVPMVFSADLLSLIRMTNPNSGISNRDMAVYEIVRSGNDWTTQLTIEEKYP